MLDLQPIKDRLARISAHPWSCRKDIDGCSSVKDADGWEVCEVNMTRETGLVNGDAISKMPTDLAALVAEVERLRGAVDEHRRTVEPGDDYCGADIILWRVLDA